MLITIWRFFDREDREDAVYYKTEEDAKSALTAKGTYADMYDVRPVPAVLLKGKYYRLVSANSVIMAS